MAESDSEDSVRPSPGQPDVVVSELLCFVQQKCNILPVDDLVKIASDFYTTEEAEDARHTLSSLVQERRLPKQKGSAKDVCARTINIIVKVLLDPTVSLPSFVARNLARLPPVDASHVDMNAVLLELSALRREVRAMADMKVEIEQLKSMLHTRANANVSVPVHPQTVIGAGDSAAGNNADTGVGGSDAADKKSFSGLAKRLSAEPTAFKNKLVRKPVFGASKANKTVISVKTVRNVDIFVSRLHPETSANELADCIHEVKGDLVVEDIQCTRLKSKYESLYTSYHVCITVDSANLRHAIEVFMSAAAWPNGVFVKRYFRQRNGPTEQ